MEKCEHTLEKWINERLKAKDFDFLLKVSGGKTLEETMKLFFPWISQLAIPGSKLTIETLEQGVNYVFKLTIKTPEGRSGAFIVNF